MNLDKLFHNFLTSGIHLPDPDTLRKHRVANGFQLIFVVGAPLLGLFYFYLGALPLFYAAIGAGVLMIGSLLLLRGTKNLALGSHCAILIAWALLLFISWHTGAVTWEGVLKPSFVLNAALILLSVFLLGYSGGAVWATVVFLQAGLILYLHSMRFPFPDLIPPDIAALYSLGTYMVALLCILIIAFLFEREKGDALIRDREKSGALRESGRAIDNILKSFPLPTFILDRSHRVIHWNGGCAELAGIPEAEILGKKVWEGFFVDERGSVADIFLDDPDGLRSGCGDSATRASDGMGWVVEHPLPRLNGGVGARVTASPILDQRGVVRGSMQTIQVIRTPQGKEPSGGSDASAFLATLPVFQVDSQTNVTGWNEACEREYGYASAEMTGKPILNLVARNYRPVFQEMIAGASRGESTAGKPFKYYRRDGRPVYVLSRACPAKTEGEGDRECLVINTDVTELRLRTKRVELYASETKEKLKSLTEEHELLKRNIASFIRGKDNAR